MNKLERQMLKDRSERVRRERCIACQVGGLLRTCGRTEEHHLNFDGKAGQPRVGDEATIPLGGWHHQGIPLRGKTTSQMRAEFGPSLRLESRAFRRAYGTDKKLLALTNQKVGHV